MHHQVALLLALLLASLPATAQGVTAFDQSTHVGVVEGTGTLAGMEYYGIESGSATLTFERAGLEQAWQNTSVQTELSEGSVSVEGVNDPERAFGTLGPTTLHLTTNQRDAKMHVFAIDGTRWDMHSDRGTLSAPEAGKTELSEGGPLVRSDGRLTAPIGRSSLWQSPAGTTNTATGDFWVSLFGWTGADDDGVLFHTGRAVTQDAGPVQVEEISNAWLRVTGGTLTVDFAEGAATRTYVYAPTITTDGTTTLTGLPTEAQRVYEGVTTLTVTDGGDRLEGVVTEGGAAEPRPALTALTSPEGAAWLWGGAGAVLFVGAFVFVALATRSVPLLEWRAYRALDRHRPLLAVFWANFWTRRDPWDGHAWSARGEARMLMGHDQAAAKDFTKAHNLLPPDERAVNALHAARCHARARHASRTAHWIGIVASLDLNVLLTAREEPDFADVWDHASVQQAVRHVLGAEA